MLTLWHTNKEIWFQLIMRNITIHLFSAICMGYISGWKVEGLVRNRLTFILNIHQSPCIL
jgi:hypothetical protein